MNYHFLGKLIFKVSQCLHFQSWDLVLYILCLPDKLWQVDLNLASTVKGRMNENNLEASDLLSVFCLYSSRLFSRFYTALWKLKYSLLQDLWGNEASWERMCSVTRLDEKEGHKNCKTVIQAAAPSLFFLTFVLLQCQKQCLQKNYHTFFCLQCVVSLIIIRNNSNSWNAC